MLKFLTELGPLIAFFLGYKTGDIMMATLYMLVASVIAMAITYFTEKTINKVHLISTVFLLISGGLTFFSGNVIFIKMKPTILYLLFSSIFLYTSYKATPAIKFVIGHSVQLRESAHWLILNKRFMFFFILMALSNELAWRNLSESAWVNFKVFGALPITILFTICQIPFIMRNSVKETPSQE